MNRTKKLTILSMLVTLALVLSIVESWIPLPFVFPGVKLGLANIITIVVIFYFGLKDTLLLVLTRCLLASLFGGGFIPFLFSIAGGVLSTIVMYILHKKTPKLFSITGISIAGSVCHNLGQIVIAIIITKDIAVTGYLPILLISGLFMGLFVGLCSGFAIKAIKSADII